MNILKFSLLCLVAVSLTACFNDDDDDNVVDPVVNSLSTLTSDDVSADAEPSQIVDPGALEQDIISLFGSADDNPLDVEMNDTVQDVIDRNKRIDS